MSRWCLAFTRFDVLTRPRPAATPLRDRRPNLQQPKIAPTRRKAGSAPTPTMQRIHSPQASDASRHRLQAIGFMLAAVTFFSGLDTAAKYLVTYEGIPVTEVVWARFIGQFVLLLTFVPALGIMSAKALFTTSRLKLQLVRSVLMVATTACNFIALRHLRLDQTVTIVFLAPL